MNKKLYIKPLCLAVEVETSSMICMSLYDEEVPDFGPIGAKKGSDFDEFEDSDNFEDLEE